MQKTIISEETFKNFYNKNEVKSYITQLEYEKRMARADLLILCFCDDPQKYCPKKDQGDILGWKKTTILDTLDDIEYYTKEIARHQVLLDNMEDEEEKSSRVILDSAPIGTQLNPSLQEYQTICENEQNFQQTLSL